MKMENSFFGYKTENSFWNLYWIEVLNESNEMKVNETSIEWSIYTNYDSSLRVPIGPPLPVLAKAQYYTILTHSLIISSSLFHFFLSHLKVTVLKNIIIWK
jgi:hypothetical protein